VFFLAGSAAFWLGARFPTIWILNQEKRLHSILCLPEVPSLESLCQSPHAIALSPLLTLEATQLLQTQDTFFAIAQNSDNPRYLVSQLPPFKTEQGNSKEPALKTIVGGVVDLIKVQGYPIKHISISLVDLNSQHCCDYAGYLDQEQRYPASVVKLFWLVALYGYYHTGKLTPETIISAEDEELMAHYSSNGAASRVLDAITQTTSGSDLDQAELQAWLSDRNQVNEFFQLAHYKHVNIAHKTFPIPELGLTERAGRDLQFANGDYKKTDRVPDSRNYLTTYEIARLLYEIANDQAISSEYSQRIKQHLRHSNDPAIWQTEFPNAIADFFGEYLPPDTQLFTKLGYTFNDGRQEAAIIKSGDGQVQFILVVFANDPMFSTEGSKLFPEIAQYTFEQMKQRQSMAESTGKQQSTGK
jgi:hypothetical protein